MLATCSLSLKLRRSSHLGLIKLHLFFLRKSEELFGSLENFLLESDWDVMIDDLEETLGEASFSNLVCTVLHPLLLSRQKVGKVNYGRGLVRRHSNKVVFNV